MAITTLSSATVTPKNRNLPTDLKRMGVSKVWNSTMRGARKQGFVTVHNMLQVVSVAEACENTSLVNHDNVI